MPLMLILTELTASPSVAAAAVRPLFLPLKKEGWGLCGVACRKNGLINIRSAGDKHHIGGDKHQIDGTLFHHRDGETKKRINRSWFGCVRVWPDFRVMMVAGVAPVAGAGEEND
ncbi:hypothetical protein HanIR_Chr05g0211841 [Helianthus annuus]|nr:hypothetical protein HanIR_Chr05g0211841 [Helianthus annuus]